MDKKIRNDIILAGLLLLLSAAGALLFFALKTDGSFASVIIDGKETSRYPLSEHTEVIIEAVGGTNTLVIKDGKAYISHADCPDGICKNHPPISHVGETIICLPHKLVVKIEENTTAASLDAAS